MRRRKTGHNVELGKFGEDLASRVLNDQGYKILTRNWRGRNGELDIVAEKSGELVVVEVKTRTNTHFGNPEAAVTKEKRYRLRSLAGQWLQAHSQIICKTIRIDVIAIHGNQSPIRVVHLRGVA